MYSRIRYITSLFMINDVYIILIKFEIFSVRIKKLGMTFLPDYNIIQ